MTNLDAVLSGFVALGTIGLSVATFLIIRQNHNFRIKDLKNKYLDYIVQNASTAFAMVSRLLGMVGSSMSILKQLVTFSQNIKAITSDESMDKLVKAETVTRLQQQMDEVTNELPVRQDISRLAAELLSLFRQGAGLLSFSAIVGDPELSRSVAELIDIQKTWEDSKHFEAEADIQSEEPAKRFEDYLEEFKLYYKRLITMKLVCDQVIKRAILLEQ